MEKNTYDTIIIGGGAAGLSGAMILARAHRKITIIDNAQQSNLASSAAHGVFTRDNTPPSELYKLAKEQLLKYPTVGFIKGKAIKATKNDRLFEVQLENGQQLFARTILLAQGVNYKLPEIPGLQELWGKKVWHCPYCHGYESASKSILAILEADKTDHMKQLLPQWKVAVTYREPSDIEQILDAPNGVIAKFKDGSSAEFDEIMAQTHHEQHDNIPEQLGCKVNDHGVLVVDNMHKTTVDGVYSAGDQSSAMQQVNFAVASGHMAGVAITQLH